MNTSTILRCWPPVLAGSMVLAAGCTTTLEPSSPAPIVVDVTESSPGAAEPAPTTTHRPTQPGHEPPAVTTTVHGSEPKSMDCSLSGERVDCSPTSDELEELDPGAVATAVAECDVGRSEACGGGPPRPERPSHPGTTGTTSPPTTVETSGPHPEADRSECVASRAHRCAAPEELPSDPVRPNPEEEAPPTSEIGCGSRMNPCGTSSVVPSDPDRPASGDGPPCAPTRVRSCVGDGEGSSPPAGDPGGCASRRSNVCAGDDPVPVTSAPIVIAAPIVPTCPYQRWPSCTDESAS